MYRVKCFPLNQLPIEGNRRQELRGWELRRKAKQRGVRETLAGLVNTGNGHRWHWRVGKLTDRLNTDSACIHLHLHLYPNHHSPASKTSLPSCTHCFPTLTNYSTPCSAVFLNVLTVIAQDSEIMADFLLLLSPVFPQSLSREIYIFSESP